MTTETSNFMIICETCAQNSHALLIGVYMKSSLSILWSKIEMKSSSATNVMGSTKLYMRSHFELTINKIGPINFRLFSGQSACSHFSQCSLFLLKAKNTHTIWFQSFSVWLTMSHSQNAIFTALHFEERDYTVQHMVAELQISYRLK